MTTDVIDIYLTTTKDEIGPMLDQLFTDDAIVHDEGRTHAGIDAIRAWNSGVATAFTFTRTVLDTERREGAAIVHTRLDGNFPGSPVELHHHFSLAGGKIWALTICP
jgi:hypothetical protein